MLPLLCSMPLISPNFDVESINFPNFGQGPFPKIAGKSPGLYCKHYGPRSDCFLRSSLIRVHSVCFHGKGFSVVLLSICTRCIKQTTFSGHKMKIMEVFLLYLILYVSVNNYGHVEMVSSTNHTFHIS